MSPYEIAFVAMFALTMLLVVFLIGLLGATCVVYWRHRNGTKQTQYFFTSLVLVNGALVYLLVGAAASLVATSLPHDDKTIFFLPPGFVVLGIGLLRKLRYYSSGNKP